MRAAPDRVFTASRVEAFSDAVLAIVMTLLVLEIKTPRLHSTENVGQAWLALVDLAPKFASFFLSFFFIAVFWVNHHRLFALIRKVDWGILWLNNLLLLLLCFVPFPTAFIGDHPRNPLALALFALVLMSAGIAFNLMWRHGRRNHLTEETLPVEPINRAIRRGLYGPMAYAIAAIAAFLAVPVSWLIFFAVPVFYAFPIRGRDTADKESAK
jgi:TMEM175 potassium channel family protein